MRTTRRLVESKRFGLGRCVALAAVLFALGASHTALGGRRLDLLDGRHLPFTATAYCDAGKTKAGVTTRSGVAAADPRVLPVGSVVRLRSPQQPRYEGIYTVMDTGGAVQGRRIDLFVADCHEARQFGLRQVLVRVLRLGWNPQASAPSLPGEP
jgi:3D (Asp-Asp-Asp) domain-containing protein